MAAPDAPIVLVIEDEPMLLAAIAKKMEKQGLRAVMCPSGEEALRMLTEKRISPDMIWLDYYLSGEMTGVDFMQSIHGRKELSKTPVIVVSNTATRKKVDQMLELGAIKYFLKAEHLLGEIIDFIWSVIHPR